MLLFVRYSYFSCLLCFGITAKHPWWLSKDLHEGSQIRLLVYSHDVAVKHNKHLGASSFPGLKLPIEFVYAGDLDLPQYHRDFISGLGLDISMVDVLQVFDDTLSDPQHGGGAFKTFAPLNSEYEQVLLLDADAILFQASREFVYLATHRRCGSMHSFYDQLLIARGVSF